MKGQENSKKASEKNIEIYCRKEFSEIPILRFVKSSPSITLDIIKMMELKPELLYLISHNPPKIVLDLAAVTKISDSAMGSLVDIIWKQKQENCSIYLANVSESIYSKLEELRLYEIIRAFSDLESALLAK